MRNRRHPQSAPPGPGDLVGAARTTVGALADLALPTSCGGCRLPGTRWCPDCARTLARDTARPFIVGGRVGAMCGPDVLVVAAGAYSGVLRAAVGGFKDGGRRDLTPVLTPVMRASLLAALTLLPSAPDPAQGDGRWQSVVPVVPAPSSTRSRRARGDVPTHLLVRGALAGVEVVGRSCLWAPVLRHARRVHDQAGLSRGERAANTAHAFSVRGDAGWLRGREVVVADDVVTTGATARECLRALRAAGARPVAVVAMAATPSGGAGRPIGRSAGGGMRT